VLGVSVAIACVVFLYYFTRDDGPVSGGDSESETPADQPDGYTPNPAPSTQQPDSHPTAYSHATPPPNPAPRQNAKPVADDDYTEPPPEPQIDCIVSARIYEGRYVVPPAIVALGDRPGSFYLAVAFKTFNNTHWVLSRDEWGAARSRVTLINERDARPTTRYPTLYPHPDHLWPEGTGDGATLLRIVFICPDGSRPKAITIEGKLWDLGKVEGLR